MGLAPRVEINCSSPGRCLKGGGKLRAPFVRSGEKKASTHISAMRLHGILLFSIIFLLDLTDDSGGGKMYNSCFLAKSVIARVRPIIAAALAIFVLTTTSTFVLPVISAFDAIADVIQQWIVRKRKRKTREEVWCASDSEKSVLQGQTGGKQQILTSWDRCHVSSKTGKVYVMSIIFPLSPLPSTVVLFFSVNFFFLPSSAI